MSEIPFLSILGRQVSAYAVLALALCVTAALAFVCVWKIKEKRPLGQAALFAVLAAVLSLLLGRGIYCAVRANSIFYDGMGDYRGLLPFFTLEEGSLNVIGVLSGGLLAALLTGLITRAKMSELLDCAAVPGILLFALLRFIEPASGQGYGPLVEDPILCFSPLSIAGGSGDWGVYWSISVCFLEALLLVGVGMFLLKVSCKTAGTRALYALTLIAGTQIIPEILRQDNVLMIFIFAPVTQMGYAALLFFCLMAALRGAPCKAKILEGALMLLGIAVLVAAEFALDKMDWPHEAIFPVMILILAAMTGMALRRIRLRDGAA